MANTINMGNQTLTWDYLNQASSLSFNKLLRDLLKAGIYRGGLLTYNAGSIEVAPFSCLVETNNVSWSHQLAVRVETTETYSSLVYSASTPYVIGELEWFEVENNFLELKCVDAAYLASNPHVIIFGKVETDFSIDYSERSYISQDADTIPLGSTLSINSQPTGGTASEFSGSSYIGGILVDIYARLIDLSGVNNAGVKKRHVDFGPGASQVNAKDFPIVDDITLGGTAGSISGATKITAALSAIATALKNLSGADTSSVKRAHISLGIGGTDLNATALPLGEAIEQTLTNLSTLSIAATDSVREAIREVGVSMAELATQLDADEDVISSILASISAIELQITNTIMQAKMLPVGTILMFDGETWVDNVTLVGWYACIPANSGRGCPNLVGQFIKGGNVGTRGSEYGVYGGVASVKLSAANLPPHTHNMIHKHVLSIQNSGIHNHNGSFYPYTPPDNYIDTIGFGGVASIGIQEKSKQTSDAGEHSHNGEASSPPKTPDGDTMNNTGDGGFSNTNVSIDPNHYSVIFIRRCS